MRRLVVFDVDGVLSGGPVTAAHLVSLERDGDVIAIVSPSPSYPRNAAGASRWPRFTSAQAAGRSRTEDLLAAARSFSDCTERVYVDDQVANRSIADAAGFSFMSPAELVRSVEFEFVPDHQPHGPDCLALDNLGRWVDLANGAVVGGPPSLEELLPLEETPRGPVPDRLWISRFLNYADHVPRGGELSWAQFTVEFSRHARAEIPDCDIGLWNAARYSKAGRHRPSPASPADVMSASMAVLDSDGIHPERIADALRARGIGFLIHSTWSHSPRYAHLRVVVPLTQPCPLGRWADVAQVVAWLVGSVPCAPERVDLARWYRTPLAREGAEVVSIVGIGEALDWSRLPDVGSALTPPVVPTHFAWRRRVRPTG